MKDDVWRNAQPHAFTTGRSGRGANPNAMFGGNNNNKKIPPRPKGPSQTLKQPGKLNLKSFAIVNEALARMNLGDSNNSSVVDRKFLFQSGNKYKSKSRTNAPLAAPEDDTPERVIGAGIVGDEQDYEEAEYEQINDGFSEAVNNIASQLFSFSSQDHPGSIRNKLRQRREKEQQSE